MQKVHLRLEVVKVGGVMCWHIACCVWCALKLSARREEGVRQGRSAEMGARKGFLLHKRIKIEILTQINKTNTN